MAFSFIEMFPRSQRDLESSRLIVRVNNFAAFILRY